jgi:hypothetical protein
MCGVSVTAEGSSYSVNLIGSDGSANATAADQDSDIYLGTLNRLSNCARVIRIVILDGTNVRAKVDYLVTSFAKLCDHPLVERVTCVISTDCNSHLKPKPARTSKHCQR